MGLPSSHASDPPVCCDGLFRDGDIAGNAVRAVFREMVTLNLLFVVVVVRTSSL